MKINGSIFNDAVNITLKLNELSAKGNEQEAVSALNDYREIMIRIANNETDHDDLADDIRANEDDGEDRESAIQDAEATVFNETWNGSGMQLLFVPRDSMLFNALVHYYDHIGGNDMIGNIKRYARSAVPAIELYGQPDGEGFYIATGCGYDTRDDFFIGVPIVHKHHPTDGEGSGIPTKRFLNYVNSDVREPENVIR